MIVIGRSKMILTFVCFDVDIMTDCLLENVVVCMPLLAETLIEGNFDSLKQLGLNGRSDLI